MSKRKKWDRIEILWVDSYRTHGWLPLEEAHIEEDYCLDHRTIGYYIGETKRQISVCQSSKTQEDLIDQPETQIDAVMNIPKSAITQVNDLANTSPSANTDLSNPQEQRIAEYKQLLNSMPEKLEETPHNGNPMWENHVGYNAALEQCRAIIQKKIEEL